MMKYGIYNRGFGNCDYDGGCVDDIKGIINLLKGEFPELSRPIVICDTKSAWDSYSGIDCIPIALDDHKSFL